MDKKKKIIIIIILFIVIIISLLGVLYYININKEKDLSTNDDVVDEYTGDEHIELNIGDSKNLLEECGENAGETINFLSDYDSSKVSVDDSGNIMGLSEGTVELNFEIAGNEYRLDVVVIDPSTSNAAVNSKNYTSTNFGNINTCVKNANSNKLTLCISNYQLHKNLTSTAYANTGMQNFAITDNYVYFSAPLNGTWTESTSALKSAYETKSTTFIERVSRSKSSGGYERQLMYIKYAGHAQSFDVIGKNSSDPEDAIYTNGLGFIGYHVNQKKYTTHSAGVAMTHFKENSSPTGVERIPGNLVKVNQSNGGLTLTLSSKYMNSKNQVITNNYYNAIKNQVKNSSGTPIYTSKDVNTYPVSISLEVASDYDGTMVVVKNGKKIYYYDNKLNFQRGQYKKATKVYTIDMSGSQGIELAKKGGKVYLYLLGGSTVKKGMTNSDFWVRKYTLGSTLGTDKKPLTATQIKRYNLYSSYFSGSSKVDNIEPEGLSIDSKGNLFMGVVVRKYSGKNLIRYDNIYTIGNGF